MNEQHIYDLGTLEEGVVEKRPSRHCKTPYVADVKMEDNTEVICHAPSLGCCGYVDKGAHIMVKQNEKTKKEKICSHTVYLSKIYEKGHEYYVGVHPKIAEKLAYELLSKNYISSLKNLKNIEREKCFMNSRFDYTCIDENNKKVILEVKNVPCADYEDIYEKDRKKRNYDSWSYDSKIAYFPDGYRKNVKDTVSPRALKHIQELEEIKKNNEDMRTILLFVIQRNDIIGFQPSIIDQKYRQAVISAYKNGVEIIPVSVYWQDNKCYFNKQVKLMI